jgi:hypothetical protein
MAAHSTASGIFGRGKTFYGGQTINTSDYGASAQLEGITTIFTNRAPPSSYGVQVIRDSQDTHAICVRNVSGIALTPGRIVRFSSGYRNRRVDGYTTLDWVRGDGVVDDHLPSAGVPNGDLFWLIVEGPALMRTDLAGGALNVISDGDRLAALTAATSQATTAGRVQSFVATTNVTNAISGVLNVCAIAMSAMTTGQTNSAVLADVKFR